jgi:hypothetical protein
MLRKPSSIVRISSQLKSSSWLISVLTHVAVIAAVSEVYITKTNHKNDGLKVFELIISQPEPNKLPQKEIPKDIAKAIPKMNSKTVSKQSIVSKPDIVSEAKIVSQSKIVSKQKNLLLETSGNKPKTTLKPKPTVSAKGTVPTRNTSQGTATTNASFSDFESKKPEYTDGKALKYEFADNDKTDLDVRRAIQLKKSTQQSLRPAMASEAKSSTNQMGLGLNKASATAPDTEQIQAKMLESKNANYFGTISNKQTSISDLSETTPNTETVSIDADLFDKKQSIINQTKFPTPNKELAVRKKLLKKWAATIRNDIIERTLGSKLSNDVRISFKISKTGEILNIETVGVSFSDRLIKSFIDVIRAPGKFPVAPHGLKLDYVTFPVNFQSRG